MNPFFLAGALSFATGLGVVLFRKPIGMVFCKAGKKVFKNSPFESLYNEDNASRNLCIMGGAFMLQSPVFVLVGWFF